MYKKAQVTVFILLGILVVAVVSMLLVYREQISELVGEISKKEAVPPEANLVSEFIGACIKDAGEEGASILGLQGGYIDISNIELGGSLPIFSNNALTVPYWYYKRDNNVDVYNVPSLSGMENELGEFVDERLKTCVDSFNIFEGYNFEYTEFKTKVEIGNNIIFIDVEFPLDVEIKDINYKFDEFKVEIDSSLGKLYGISREIFEKGEEDYFLEEQTLDMLRVYDELPYSSVSLECEPLVWIKSDLVEDFKKIISSNLEFINIDKTNYELAKEDYDRLVWDVTKKRYDDIHVDVKYSSDWPLELDVVPSEGELLRAEGITSNLGPVSGIVQSFFCMQNYHFIYDIKYPVLFFLNDVNSGEVFQFASHVVIDNNQARNASILAESVEEPDSRFCDNPSIENSVFTFEEVNNKLVPLEDVSVQYRCINHYCDIGKTKLDEYGESVLSSKFIYCVNGEVIAEKEGYHRIKEEFSTNTKGSVSIVLDKIVDVPVNISVIRPAGDNKVKENENIIIQFIDNDKEYYASYIYPGSVKLIPGEYEVRSYIVSEVGEGINIESKEVEVCFDVPKEGIFGILGGTKERCKKTVVPGTVLKKVISGGGNFNLTITKEDLDMDYVIFYVNYYGLPSSYDELANFSNFKDGNIIYPRFLDYE